MNTEQAAAPLVFHPAIKAAAKVVSYIFHPLFIPLYVGWFFIYVLRIFPVQAESDQFRLMAMFFVSYTLLPLATVLLSKGLGFIESVHLHTQKDRIIPYMAAMVFYFWVWYVFRNQGYPRETRWFAMAVFLSTCFGVFFNHYLKVSMHGISVGLVLTLVTIMALRSNINFAPFLSTAFLLGGLISTARLINNDHSPTEVYAGIFTGVLSLLVAWLFI